MTATHNALLGALSRHSHFDEFSEPLNKAGNILTPAQRKALARANLEVGAELTTPAGAGITGGTGTVYQSSVQRRGGLIVTEILIDLTGLHSEAADGDIIGVDASSSPAHLGQNTEEQNVTILGGIVRCLEVPAGGDPNIALYAADEATGVEDGAITSLTNDAVVFDPNADWTIDMARSITGIPGDGQYLYLVQGDATGTDADYTAGKFLITLYGYDA